jgi:hypothetical protein
MEQVLCVQLKDMTQDGLSISGAVVRERVMPVKAAFKTVSEVQASSIQGHL